MNVGELFLLIFMNLCALFMYKYMIQVAYNDMKQSKDFNLMKTVRIVFIILVILMNLDMVFDLSPFLKLELW